MEIEENVSLPFLDVELIKNELTYKIDRKVYRKKCRSNNTISYSSKILVNYQKAPYRFYIRIAFEVSSKAYLEDDLTKIKIIATENGYPKKFIYKIIEEFNNKKSVTRN